MFDRVHYSEEARNALQRADRAREMLRQALAEQESAESAADEARPFNCVA